MLAQMGDEKGAVKEVSAFVDLWTCCGLFAKKLQTDEVWRS